MSNEKMTTDWRGVARMIVTQWARELGTAGVTLDGLLPAAERLDGDDGRRVVEQLVSGTRELARLKPSAQVAEDVERARAKIAAALGEHGRALECHGALSMLAAKARGYEAAVEAQEQMRVAFKQELDASQAEARRAGEEWGKIKAERDAAVADNAVLMDGFLRVMSVFESLALDAEQAGDAARAGEHRRSAENLRRVHAQPHRCTALLEQHSEALAAAERRHETTRATMHVREEARRKEVDALRAVVDGLASEMERTLKHREQTGGMRVPDHGDFASAPPSMLGRMRWWAREMRAALGGSTSALLVRARNDGLELVRAEAERQAGEYEALTSDTARDRAKLLRDLVSDIVDMKERDG